MLNEKYRHFYFWENLIKNDEKIFEGLFRNQTITEQSVFLNTVIVNCNTNILYDNWICFPEVEAALGFIQNVFMTSAFDTYLSPTEDSINIINETVEELLETVDYESSELKRMSIEEIKTFIEEIDVIWDGDNIYDKLKCFSYKFNDRWGKVDSIFFYFNIFDSASEVGDYVIKGYEEENMLDYFKEETGLTKEQWQDIYQNVYQNAFIKKRFMDILNNRICNLI